MSWMPPLFMIVHILPNRAHRGLRLWVPVFLIWILLLPFVLVLLPVFFILCAVIDIHPFRTLGAFLQLLGSLGGTHIEVDNPDTSVFIHVY
ncbi:MAG: hypothetical protein ISS15_00365 [Alphaproteobacteria bacterium]|nr:hypothetical protein [Alphaproteobacteria bacterium]MBL6937355.1 hypothetical protein [Alphaproteobacteria bacterium]MBL7096083.1 hypothetical protein [Alphaproteobacteria bacterium]